MGSLTPWRASKVAVGFAAGAMVLALLLHSRGHLYWSLYILIATTGILLAAASWLFLRDRLSSHPKLKHWLQNVWVTIVSLFFLLMVLEAIFRVFVARSDGYVFTLASKNWMKRYWAPVNSLGYRDYEWRSDDCVGRVKVLVVGDSIAGGYGIRKIDDRFSNILGELLGDRYVVMTVAQSGWQTPDELAALETYPYQPDIVVLSYYINDIIPAAQEHGMASPTLVSAANDPLVPLISTSYLLNFTYYQIIRLPNLQADDIFLRYLQDAYKDPVVWETHRSQLAEFQNWSEAHHASLIVVVFPSLLQPANTSFATEKVAQIFRGMGVPVLDLTSEFVGDEPRTLVVNSVDSHPNEAVHKYVAHRLYDLIKQIVVSPENTGG